tara:strand:- start:9 stop:188 length:180 start_codon:yes stop_codon:yes gene_type:complete
MTKKNVFKMMDNQGHLRPDEKKFQYNVKKSVETNNRIKPKDVFENYVEVKKKVKKKVKK